MSLATFNIVLVGGKHQGNTAESSAYSSVIIGIDGLLTYAAREIYDDLVEPEIDIRRKSEGNVFEVDYGFRTNMGRARRAALSGDYLLMNPDPLLIVEGLGLGKCTDSSLTAGVIPLLFNMNGDEIRRIRIDNDRVNIIVREDRYTVSYIAYRLLRERHIRHNLARIAGALSFGEFEAIEFRDRVTNDLIQRITIKDIKALSEPEDKVVNLVDDVREMALSLAAPSFRNQETWTFDNGTQRIYAQMKDEHFLRVVDNGVLSLRPGDVLIVHMHVHTTQTLEGGLKSTYDVIRVLDFRWAGQHLPMPGA